MKIDVVDVTEERAACLAAIDATPSAVECARDLVQAAIVDLAMARRELYAIDARAAAELDVALVRILFGGGGRA